MKTVMEGKTVKDLDDARLLLPTKYDHEGNRFLEFYEGVKSLAPESYDDWPVVGDRALPWLLKFVYRNGGTFGGRHTKWRIEEDIVENSAADLIHDLIGECLDVGLTYDQLDVSNVAAFELLGRVYQLVEDTSGAMMGEGIQYLTGHKEGRKGRAVAPSLSKHRTEKLERDNRNANEQRKAREELASKADGFKANAKATPGKKK